MAGTKSREGEEESWEDIESRPRWWLAVGGQHPEVRKSLFELSTPNMSWRQDSNVR